MLYLAFPQPVYKGPVRIAKLDTETFRRVVEAPAASSNVFKDPSNKPKKPSSSSNEHTASDTSYLVMFYSIDSADCNHVAPLFAELCEAYESHLVQFLKVNVDSEPLLAKRYRINASAASGSSSDALPSFILFERGREVRRLPNVRADGTVVSKPTITKVCVHAAALTRAHSESTHRLPILLARSMTMM